MQISIKHFHCHRNNHCSKVLTWTDSKLKAIRQNWCDIILLSFSYEILQTSLVLSKKCYPSKLNLYVIICSDIRWKLTSLSGLLNPTGFRTMPTLREILLLPIKMSDCYYDGYYFNQWFMGLIDWNLLRL